MMTPGRATLTIVVACGAGFALQWLTRDAVLVHLALWSPDTGQFRPEQLLTHAFLHGGFGHLAMNMFAVLMFGPPMERLFGSWRFGVYYLCCVLSAAISQLMIDSLAGNPGSISIGASGGVFGLLLAFGMVYPRERIMLVFPPIPMPAWLFVSLFGAAELYMGIAGREPQIGHFAHLGGMIGGAFLMLVWGFPRPRAST